jgi:tetratricopeptide (TPR) repeat protein
MWTRFVTLIVVAALAFTAVPARADGLGEAEAGMEAMERGDLDDALAHFEKALAARDLNAEQQAAVMTYRGIVRLEQGNAKDALADFDAAIAIEPKAIGAWANRGIAYDRLGACGPAVASHEKALSLMDATRPEAAPDIVTANSAIAWLLATCPDAAQRDGARAVRHGETALEVLRKHAPKDADPFIFAAAEDSLAAAYAEAGQYDRAAATQRTAIGRLKSDTDMRADFTQRLDNYVAGKPWRDVEQPKSPAGR